MTREERSPSDRVPEEGAAMVEGPATADAETGATRPTFGAARALGYALITLGFLYAAYVAVAQVEGVPVGRFLLGLGAGVAGVVLVRVALHRSARHEDHLTANIQAIADSLATLAQRAEELEATKEGIDVYELRHWIDREFVEPLDTFVEARETIAVSYGLDNYAEIMNHFAAGERYLRRVWSASTDGYVDEAHDYVTKAVEQFDEALAKFRALRGEG